MDLELKALQMQTRDQNWALMVGFVGHWYPGPKTFPNEAVLVGTPSTPRPAGSVHMGMACPGMRTRPGSWHSHQA